MPNLWLTLYRLTQDRRKRAILQAFDSEANYQASLSEVTKFWSRCPEPPDFRGKSVLDLGCGLGALVFDAARRGAARVVGIEILDEFTQANNRRLAEEFPQFKDRVEFRTVYLADAGPEKFDIILSKDSFEHILELEEHLAQMKAHLNPQGRIYVGFAPLYRAPRGDHRRMQTKLPWGHVIFPEAMMLRALREMYPETKLESVADLGLNKLSVRELRGMIRRQGLRAHYFRINVGGNPALRLFNLGRGLPGLSEYFTQNIYMILGRAED